MFPKNHADTKLSMADLKPNRLLFVVNVDWYFSLHWIERAVAAKDAGFKVHIATKFTDEANLKKWKSEGFVCHHIPLTKSSINFLRDCKAIWMLNCLIKTISPILIHCITIKPNLYAGTLAILQGTSAVKSVTGLGTVFSNRQPLYRLLRWLVIKWYRTIDRFGRGAFIFENNENKELFKNRSITVRQAAELIRGAGVCLNTFSFKNISEKEIPVILFAGRLLRDKGLETLINAVQEVLKCGNKVELEVAGICDTDAAGVISVKEIELWHRLGKLKWLGERKDMPQLLAHADIVALPTQYGEGVPRILLEAAATGRPLIATDVAGCRDIVVDGKTGILVPPNDQKALELAIVELVKNPEKRTEMGRAAHLRAAELFTQKMVVSKTLSVYKTIVARQ